MNAEGCDSIITLTLTAHNDTTDIPVSILKDALPYVVDAYYTVPADAPISTPFEEVVKETNTDCSYRRYSVMVSSCSDTYNYSDNICEDQTSYSGYGFNIAAVNLPAPGASKDYTRNAANTAGCDSVITLTLTVNIGDTTDVAVNKLNTELPFAVDEYYTVPADATIGTPFEVVKKMGDTGCSFKRYMVTISQCTQSFDYSDNICSDQTSYSGYGFSIALNELPAPGNSKEFNRNAKDENGCDSVITFTLAVTLNDTTDVIVTKETTDLPYYVDEHYTVPADAIVGTPFEVIVKLSNADCSYNRYKVTISDVSTGWTNLTDAIDHIEIYDALGHRITIISAENTLRQIQLPAGVYMQRVVMRNGNAQTGKFVIR